MSVQQKPSQADRLHDWLVARGRVGVHTFEIRAAFIGNPSQRRAELEERGYAITVGPKERLNGSAMGVRYWLAEHAPASVPVVVEASGQYALTEDAA